MTFNITDDYAGSTVLSFLKSILKISTSALTGLKNDPIGILVNGTHVTVRYVLNTGDTLFINEKDSFDDTNETITPTQLNINLLFENNDIIIADKPPYMPTHPSHGHIDDTLANAIAHIYKERNEPFVFRPIGRLDRNTSGVSIVAKSSISASYLYYARQKSQIEKKYIAILKGSINSDSDLNVIDTYMKRSEDSIIVRCVADDTDDDAFRAITHWRLLYSNSEISIVEAMPQTGRTHQLRVHFSHLGHPILGDDIYGNQSDLIGRHALHAYSIKLPMPYTGETKVFYSPLPQDMVDVINTMAPNELHKIEKMINKD